MKRIDNISLGYESDYFDKNRFFVINSGDKKIFVIESKADTPIGTVIIVPPYGKTSHEMVLLGYYLQQNGFNVIRFDGIDNAGLSSGPLVEYKVSQIENDLDLVVKNINKAEELPLICLSLSLSFPASLKYESKHNVFDKLISVVGVIDVVATSERVISRSLDVWERREPDAPKFAKVFGHDVLAQQYVDDIYENNYAHFDHSVEALNKISCPLKMIVADNDEYVSIDEFNKFKRYFSDESEYIILENASHEIGRSMTLTKKIARLIVEYALPNANHEIKIPRITDVIKNLIR